MLMDEGILNSVQIHLQALGTHIMAQKLADFLGQDDIMDKHGIDQKITIKTASWYLTALSYQFTEAKKGQYVDGHDWKDVIYYCDYVFLPKWAKLQCWVFHWNADGKLKAGPLFKGCRVIIWYHDETIFYAHD